MAKSWRSSGGGSLRFALGEGPEVRAVRIHIPDELPDALRELGLGRGRPVIALVGGADGLDNSDLVRLRPLFVEGLAPLARDLGACVVDGGTDAGVMRLMGEARGGTGSGFPLVGVVAAGTVDLPGEPNLRPDAAPLEPHHSHFVLVPGSRWGDESPWLARVAGTLAGGSPSITVLVNGGKTTREDASLSVTSGRTVIAVAGSGGAADVLAGAVGGGSDEEWARGLAGSGFVRVVELLAGPDALVQVSKKLLAAKG